MLKSILLSSISFLIALIIPFFFNEILLFVTENLGLGWVATTILIRLLVILFFILFLKFIFAAFSKTKHLKNWISILIGSVAGFFLCFAIVPIYSVDYGIFDDQIKLDKLDELNTATGGTFVNENTPTLLAFVTTSCPFCKIACQKLGANVERGQSIKVDFIFPGTREDADIFLEENNGTSFNSHLIGDEQTFINYSGSSFPSIFILDTEGNTSYHWVGDQMNFSALDYLLSLEQ